METRIESSAALCPAIAPNVPSTPAERVAMAFFGSGGTLRPTIVAICAEPGMGREDAMSRVLALAGAQGARVVRRDFRDATPGAACRSLVRLARQLSEGGSVVAVGIYELPPSDESQVVRQARAIRRMRDAGAAVLLVVRPEARQLLEALPERLSIAAETLLYSPAQLGGERASQAVLRVTRGIPRLVRAVSTATRDSLGSELPLEYYDALASLLESALRPSLSDEERRLRLAMILLGDASTSELREVLGILHDDLLASLGDGAPLFGLARDLTVFNCLSGAVPGALSTCLRRVAPTSALFPDVAPACLSHLVERGRISRASILATLPECVPALPVVAEHAAEFIDAGECRLVLHAAEVAEGLDEGDRSRIRTVVRALDTHGACPLPREMTTPPGDGSALGLLVGARRLLQGRVPSPGLDIRASGELGRRLAAHVAACSLMLRGAFSVALGMLLGTPEEAGRPCVSGALLAIDRDLAQMLAGGSLTGADEAVERAGEFIRRRPLRGLSGCLVIHDLVRAALGSVGARGEGLGGVALGHERSADPVVQVVALLAGAFADLWAGSVAGALVRATRAESVARQFDSDYLARLALLLSDVSRFVLGDDMAPRVAEEPRDDLDEVATLVWEVMLTAEGERLVAASPRDEVPWDGLWLIRALLACPREISAGLLEHMPARWRRALPRPDPASRAPEPPVSEPPRAPEPAFPEASKPVRVSLLGGFALSVRGRRVPEERLNRRNTKSMLTYLVLHGGRAKRFQVAEQVWPDCDYTLGFGRVYQATTALRSIVAEVDDTLSLFVSSRKSGEVTIDMGLVSCDVPEFRALAREAVDSHDAERSLECAQAAERLYAGDLYLPPSDATGFVASVRAELKCLYADAMVEGSAAALELGRDRTAVRLAENAVMADEMREDAVSALVRALTACGREADAARERRAFEGRVARLARHGRGSRARESRRGGEARSEDAGTP